MIFFKKGLMKFEIEGRFIENKKCLYSIKLWGLINIPIIYICILMQKMLICKC